MKTTVFMNKKAISIPLMALLVLGTVAPVFGQQTESRSGYEEVPQFGGPKSVGGQVKSDAEVKKTPYWFKGFSQTFQPYYDFKARVQQNYGLSFGADYNFLYQGASESLGEDNAASGVLRFYGTWTLLGQGSQDTGAITFKVENRHRLGTDISPQDLGFAAGYAGLTAGPFSDIDWALTNLFWEQHLADGGVSFVAGVVDTTDYVDTYGLVSPWSDFINPAFSTTLTIPAPNQGLGAALQVMVTDNYYIHGGLADANGDPTRPEDSFGSFFDDGEYFSHLEWGWIQSKERRYSDSIHLTAWYADSRELAMTESGWGLAFSWNRLFDETWEPFVRAGYSEDGGALWENSLGIGLGYHLRNRTDMAGIGLNWSQPSETTLGQGLDDQYTVECYYRLQLLDKFALTPDVQLLFDPAMNPNEDLIVVFGLRARLSF